MAKDKIRYRSGFRHAGVHPPMRSFGFRLVNFGLELAGANKARAIALNDEWDLQPHAVAWQGSNRRGKSTLSGSAGEGYRRALCATRSAAANGPSGRAEQEKRVTISRGPGSGWAPRSEIRPPTSVKPEHFLSLNSQGKDLVCCRRSRPAFRPPSATVS